VNDYPFLVPTDGYSNRLHDSAAGSGAVAGAVIQMDAAQARGAVIAVSSPWGSGTNNPPAMMTGEHLFFIDFVMHVKKPRTITFLVTQKPRLSRPRLVQRYSLGNFYTKKSKSRSRKGGQFIFNCE
jgi:hypothetical protein